jgi:hypothetical protein
VTLDGNGVFVDGQIASTVQLRPAGPSLDEKQRALNMIRGLSIDDFGSSGLLFESNGRIVSADRAPFEAHELVVTPD